MKPVLMIAVIFGAVVAGAAGGYVASSMAPEPERTSPRVAAAADTDAKTESKDDLSPLVSKHGNDIAGLRGEIDSLVSRVDAAEKKVTSLETEKTALQTELSNLKKQPATGGGTTVPTADPDSVAFKEAVNKAIEEKEAADRAARDAEREKQMAEFVANANKQMVDRLTTELSLTADQVPKIQAIIEDMSAKRREVWTKGEEARRNGTEFDWGTEMGNVTKASTDAVRAELSSAQLTTFNELVGDRGLSALERGFGGMGRQGGGQGRGGRGGGGGNNN